MSVISFSKILLLAGILLFAFSFHETNVPVMFEKKEGKATSIEYVKTKYSMDLNIHLDNNKTQTFKIYHVQNIRELRKCSIPAIREGQEITLFVDPKSSTLGNTYTVWKITSDGIPIVKKDRVLEAYIVEQEDIRKIGTFLMFLSLIFFFISLAFPSVNTMFLSKKT